jgi:S-adenosylmethionine:tRNA ribosyltransferase-isomerase
MHVPDLTTELVPGTLLILNDSRVFPSRLIGKLPTGGSVETFLLEPLNETHGEVGCIWRALGRPMKKLKRGTGVYFNPGLEAEVVDKADDGAGNGLLTLRFNKAAPAMADWLDQFGYIPLPPYIKRDQALPAASSPDRTRYQTVYARQSGSVAAPTAGLHFTDALLQNLRLRGIEICFVSLHVGAGTFLPVKTQDLSHHKMHTERYRVSRKTAEAICLARSEGRKVVAVGTTALRSLESLYRQARGDTSSFISQADAWLTTDLFLYPSFATDVYRPWVVDALITNFHQPCSTLFMLVSSLLGLDSAKRLYNEAISSGYRLFSYGDTSLLWL